MVFIAEIGLNHNGNFNLCYEMIKQAKNSGADIVKFQLGWRSAKHEINYITPKILSDLIEWSNYFEIKIMFSIFTEDHFKMIKKFNPEYYKIASRTLVENLPLVKNIIKTNKKIFISTGMLKSSRFPIRKNKNINILWCKSKYPTYLDDLKKFPKNFLNSKYQGYSDHCIGIETCLLAISRGAQIIEKHFTLDKSDKTIHDHVISATPSEFKSLVQIGRDINKKINYGI